MAAILSIEFAFWALLINIMGDNPICSCQEKKLIFRKKVSNQKHRHPVYFWYFFEEHLTIKPLQTFCNFQRVSHLVGTLHLIVMFIRHAPSGDHPSSLIQVVGFSERPYIVPHEVRNGLNVHNRALSLICVHALCCKL